MPRQVGQRPASVLKLKCSAVNPRSRASRVCAKRARTGVHVPQAVATQDRGERADAPRWRRTSRTRLDGTCRSMWGRGAASAPFKRTARAVPRVSSTRVRLPAPDGPETTVRPPTGATRSTPRRFRPVAPRSTRAGESGSAACTVGAPRSLGPRKARAVGVSRARRPSRGPLYRSVPP